MEKDRCIKVAAQRAYERNARELAGRLKAEFEEVVAAAHIECRIAASRAAHSRRTA